MSELSNPLNNYWNKQIATGSVQAKPFSGNCMLCAERLTQDDKDHSVCNVCWDKTFEEE